MMIKRTKVTSNMNEYYINILEQMGYEVTNPDLQNFGIVRKGSKENLKVFDDGSYVKYSDISNNFEISIYKKSWDFIMIKFRDIKISFDFSLPCDNDQYDIYLASDDKFIRIVGNLYEVVHCSDSVANIDCNFNDAGFFRLRQCLNGISANYTILSESIEATDLKLPLSDCTIDNILKSIIEFLGHFKDVEESIPLQKGLIYVIPSLSKFISNMLDYRKEVIPEAIEKRKEALIKKNERLAEIDNESKRISGEISKIEGEIQELQELSQNIMLV